MNCSQRLSHSRGSVGNLQDSNCPVFYTILSTLPLLEQGTSDYVKEVSQYLDAQNAVLVRVSYTLMVNRHISLCIISSNDTALRSLPEMM